MDYFLDFGAVQNEKMRTSIYLFPLKNVAISCGIEHKDLLKSDAARLAKHRQHKVRRDGAKSFDIMDGAHTISVRIIRVKNESSKQPTIWGTLTESRSELDPLRIHT